MISVVVPIMNEEETVQLLYDRVCTAAETWGEQHELVLVDDGSVDASLQRMTDLVDRDPRVRAVKLSRNFGHQAAITAGIRAASGDAVVVMDGDLQDPPEEIVRLVETWRAGYDVVYGVRTKRKESLGKRTAYAAFYRLLNLISDIDLPVDAGDFCLMDRRVVETLEEEMPEQIRYIRGLRAYAGFRQIGLPYERDSRSSGEVKYTFARLVGLAVDGLFGFSMLPLRLAAYLGFLIAIPSFLLGFYFILHRAFDFVLLDPRATETPGLASLAVGLFFLSGLILIMLGVIGEYVGRIYIEVKRRPSYIVDAVYGGPAPSRAQPDDDQGTGRP